MLSKTLKKSKGKLQNAVLIWKRGCKKIKAERCVLEPPLCGLA